MKYVPMRSPKGRIDEISSDRIKNYEEMGYVKLPLDERSIYFLQRDYQEFNFFKVDEIWEAKINVGKVQKEERRLYKHMTVEEMEKRMYRSEETSEYSVYKEKWLVDDLLADGTIEKITKNIKGKILVVTNFTMTVDDAVFHTEYLDGDPLDIDKWNPNFISDIQDVVKKRKFKFAVLQIGQMRKPLYIH